MALRFGRRQPNGYDEVCGVAGGRQRAAARGCAIHGAVVVRIPAAKASVMKVKTRSRSGVWRVDSLGRVAADGLHPYDGHGRKQHLGDTFTDFPSVWVPSRTLHEQASAVYTVFWGLLVVVLFHHFKIKILRGGGAVRMPWAHTAQQSGGNVPRCRSRKCICARSFAWSQSRTLA